MATHIQKIRQLILIVEIDSSLRANLAQHLRQEGFGVLAAESAQDARALLAEVPISLVLLGLKDLKREGIAILQMIREGYPQVKVITINSGEQFDLSIEGMRLGAHDDFLIPFDLDTLMQCIRRALGEDQQK